MLTTWQINALAATDAAVAQVTQGNGVPAILRACPSCIWLRVGYTRVILPTTIVTWRLDLVFSPSSDRQGVVCLADSGSSVVVAEPRVGEPAQWRRDHVFPGAPCTAQFELGSLRLLCTPLPVADWSATIDLDIIQPNPTLEPCQ